MKKIGSIIAVIVILLIIGKIIVIREVKDLEKDIVQSVKKGDYYTAIQDSYDIEYQGEKMSRKIAKLIEDVKLYGAAEQEMAKYSEMNLGRVKAILDAMNGSYKKYSTFKADVKNLQENVKQLEKYGDEGVELTKKIEKLIKSGDKEEAKKLINEYRSDKKYEYMPKSLKNTLSEYLNQISEISW